MTLVSQTDEANSLDRVEEALIASGSSKGAGSSWQCPAHDDNNPSLSVTYKNGRTLLHCFAGCEAADVLEELGLSFADLSDEDDADGAETDPTLNGDRQPGPVPEWVAGRTPYPGRAFNYVDEQNQLLFTVHRGADKTFRQQAADGTWTTKGLRRVLFRLPDVLKRAADGGVIHVVEGEKDAEACHLAGLLATCNPGGAGKWQDEYADALKGASEVIVWQDKDDPGRKHAEAVTASLDARQIPYRLVEARTGKDPWDHFAAGWTVEDAVPVNAVAKVPARLPEGFWNSRPVLAHIRQAAHAYTAGADATLYAVLARLSSLLPGDLRVQSGIGKTGASLNLFAALVSPPAVGKSISQGCADDLVPVPDRLETTGNGEARYRCNVPVGTGEGLCELYMGVKDVQVEASGDAKPRSKPTRMQVRSNAHVYVDEGGTLTALMLKREGSILGQTIRTLWIGGETGQSNGSAERTRQIREYSMGILVGFQPETALPMLTDVGPGTPQRFIWAQADDPTIPYEAPDDPGPLWSPGYLPKLLKMDPFTPMGPAGADAFSGATDPYMLGNAARTTVTMEASIRARNRKGQIDKHRGAECESHNAHRPLMLTKLSGLLAILDGRTHITEDDWALATTMWGTSCAVRDGLLRSAERSRDKAAKERTESRVKEAVAVKGAVSADSDAVERVARRMVRALERKDDHRFTWCALKTAALSGSDKVYASRALDHAEARGWLAVEPTARGKAVVLGDTAPRAA